MLRTVRAVCVAVLVAIVLLSSCTPAPRSGLNWPALRRCESGGRYNAVSASGAYRGAYQFDRATWRSVGGVGDPAAASPVEQDRRAAVLHSQRGRSPWPVCGRRL